MIRTAHDLERTGNDIGNRSETVRMENTWTHLRHVCSLFALLVKSSQIGKLNWNEQDNTTTISAYLENKFFIAMYTKIM